MDTATIRSFGELKRVHEENRTATFVASNEAKDRHNTVLNSQGWELDNFNRNPIIGYNHNVYFSTDPDDIIGRGRAYMDGNDLLVDVNFEPEGQNEKADKIYRKVENGTLNAVSVGFLPKGEGNFGEGSQARGKEDETFFFKGQELLEVSIVTVPSNATALKKQLHEDFKDNLKSLPENDLNEIYDRIIEIKSTSQEEEVEDKAPNKVVFQKHLIENRKPIK
jgi:HK97 family phage prohead protease